MVEGEYRLYEMADSGNCYKVRLILNQLHIVYERIPVNILKGESRTDSFLAMNPNGRVPLLILPDGQPLAESNAILCYLSDKTPLCPDDPIQKALTLQWLFFEQYSNEPFIATNRFFRHILKDIDKHSNQIEQNEPRGYAALDVMETHLADHRYFSAEHYGIADIALYAYTHAAHEGGYNLAEYRNIKSWLTRVTSQPRHIGIGD